MMDRRSKNRVRKIPPEILVAAYSAGYFPMADSTTGEISWYSPDPRAILELDAFHVSRSFDREIRSGMFEIRVDTAFEDVMRGCAAREETWISEEIIAGYGELFRLGLAHSVECWHDGTLAGGLYGVALGGAFFGESMFSRERSASKVALAHLVERLRRQRFELLDTQFLTPHLQGLGATEIPRDEYVRRLSRALKVECVFHPMRDSARNNP